MKHLLTAVVLATLSATAAAASTMPVDLSTWVENGNPNNGAGNWVPQSGNDSVRQTINGTPTIFHDNTGSALGKALSGTIEVYSSGGDDDFVGFVLGYDNNEINSTAADFWLIDWKRGDQSGQNAGLSLSHVNGNLVGTGTGTTGEWWQHTGPIQEVQTGATLGTTGWAPNTVYTFDLVFTSTNITVSVNGVEELNYNGSFNDGGFGFYNFSQQGVEYAGITEADAPAVPLPASLPLLAAGFGAIALMRRKRQAA